MEAFLQPLAAAVVGFGLSWIPRDVILRARLRVAFALGPTAWALIILWAVVHYRMDGSAPNWVLNTLALGGAGLIVAAAVSSTILAARRSTWFYVLPFVAVVAALSANSWLLAYMGLNHAWF
jgi:hypothetical protein